VSFFYQHHWSNRQIPTLLFIYFRPFNNPTETYRYYSLPFCHEHSTEEEEAVAAQDENVDLPDFETEKRLGAQKHRQRLGESIVGDRRETSPYEISYGDSVEWRLLCKKLLRPTDIESLKEAIHNNYFFEMFVEDLPLWGYIGDVTDDYLMGETEGSKTYLFTHLHFYIGQNLNQIVAAKVTTDVSFDTTLCFFGGLFIHQ
jgi:transmembrane 9 superfamily member 1